MTTRVPSPQTQFGTGAPVATAPDNTRYFDTTITASWAQYVCFGGTWYPLGGGTKGNLGIFAKVSTLVATYPASTTLIGAVAVVKDSTRSISQGIGRIVVGLSTNIVPVFCNGTNWLIN